jgi:hypothetical protein
VTEPGRRPTCPAQRTVVPDGALGRNLNRWREAPGNRSNPRRRDGPACGRFHLTDSDWSDGDHTAAHQDVTSSHQTLGSNSRGADHIRDTRDDDRTCLRYSTYHFGSSSIVTGVRIDTVSSRRRPSHRRRCARPGPGRRFGMRSTEEL